MALPTTRSQFIGYIKRKLGEGFATPNVTQEQIDERIDEALALFQEHHFEGTERTYLKHQLTWSNLTFSTATTGTFTDKEMIVGQTSNAHAVVNTQTSNTELTFKYSVNSPLQTFAVGETVLGKSSNSTGVIATVELGDWDLRTIPMSNNVISVVRVLPLDGFLNGGGTGLFSWNQQFVMNDMMSLTNGSVQNYFLMRQHMKLLNDLFNGDVAVDYSRYKNELRLMLDWNKDIRPGAYIVVEAMVALQPEAYARIWSDRFFREYATALVKKQWGWNLIKYGGVLPGGVTLNADKIYEEGKMEVDLWEQRIRQMYELPTPFIMG